MVGDTLLCDYYEDEGNPCLCSIESISFKAGIPINGLVWMGDREFMQKQIREKIAAGYRCIKLKVGALDFETELEIISGIRQQFSPEDIEIRLDANGGFMPADALEKLKRLSEYSIHSIEQPIKPRQWEAMAEICEKSPIPVVLDEELIVTSPNEAMLQQINPAYIILKPSLLGGFRISEEWIRLAENNNIGWWITSALEANVGLNAIAQWTASLNSTMPQGLGTGQLYHNNIPSPLEIREAKLWYNQNQQWDLSSI
jgi:L-alanine-DL-glutamate epimerase-like enolase superfamily enzyme